MKNFILMGDPHHGNIGDSAIAVAQEAIIRELFGNCNYYTIGEKYLDVCAERAKPFIKDDDIIILQGGGNIGNIYERPEKGRRKVIELFPNNKIILFPQTVYFSDDEQGRKELEITKRIYNNHPNLILMAREKKSLDFMNEHFTNAKIYFTPDIVMTLNKQEDLKREGALLLFRSDKEKSLKDEFVKDIENKMMDKYKKVEYSDMYIGSGMTNVGGKYRDEFLNEKFKQFQTAEIVITDRLHGMILSAITGTPCIAFGNFNHKVKLSFEWLRHLGYIEFCEGYSEFDNALEKITQVKNPKYDNTFAREIIIKVLNEEIK